MTARSRATVAGLVIGVAALVAAGPAAAGTTEPSGPDTTTTESAATTPDTLSETTADRTAPAGTADGATDSVWEQLTPGGDCQCADGSEWSYFVREADPDKVAFFLEGGGACWSAETCATGGPYDPDVGADEDPATIGGVFDLDNPDNPFGDWSIVYVPYCTGDVHIGNVERDYGDGLTIQHRGARNGATALATLSERFPDASQIVVAGASAGSIATPLYAGMVQDRYPDADVIAIGDGSGGYPADGGEVNQQLLATWGFSPLIAAWPEAATVADADWNFTRFWSLTAEHAPDVELARFDFAQDAVQLAFIGYAGLQVGDLFEAQEANEATIEASGANQQSFVVDGDGHTVTGSDTFYSTELDGVSVSAWVAQVIADEEPVADLRPTSSGPTETTATDDTTATTTG